VRTYKTYSNDANGVGEAIGDGLVDDGRQFGVAIAGGRRVDRDFAVVVVGRVLDRN
jgi:hypothetical protein